MAHGMDSGMMHMGPGMQMPPQNMGSGMQMPPQSQPPTAAQPYAEPSAPERSGLKIHLSIGLVIRDARVVEFKPEGVVMEQEGRRVLLTCRSAAPRESRTGEQ
jgi:hypothetical protein